MATVITNDEIDDDQIPIENDEMIDELFQKLIERQEINNLLNSYDFNSDIKAILDSEFFQKKYSNTNLKNIASSTLIHCLKLGKQFFGLDITPGSNSISDESSKKIIELLKKENIADYFRLFFWAFNDLEIVNFLKEKQKQGQLLSEPETRYSDFLSSLQRLSLKLTHNKIMGSFSFPSKLSIPQYFLLFNALTNNSTITEIQINFEGAEELGCVGMTALIGCLRLNPRITSLSLVNSGISDQVLGLLFKALEENSIKLTSLNLVGNGILCSDSLAKMLKSNISLVSLNLEGNQFTHGLDPITKALKNNHEIIEIKLGDSLDNVFTDQDKKIEIELQLQHKSDLEKIAQLLNRNSQKLKKALDTLIDLNVTAGSGGEPYRTLLTQYMRSQVSVTKNPKQSKHLTDYKLL